MSYIHENVEQECLFKWAALNSGKWPELDLLHHIPNGGKRDKREAANFKRQGVKAGIPDICLPVARGGYHGLYIELKAGNNKTTKNQEKWLAALRKQGFYATVCRGWLAAAETIETYLKGVPKNENQKNAVYMYEKQNH